ncbi:MAG: MATE family efflux transporter [Oscillospiraceae bacterium]
MNKLVEKFFFSKKLMLETAKSGEEIPAKSTLLKKAFRVAWPSTLESFLVAIVSVVDTIMVSSLGDYAIAAIGLTNQPKFLGLAAFLSLNVAVSAIVARRRGENDREGANRVLMQALLLTGGFAIVISILCVTFADPILRLAGTNADTHSASVAYFRIIMGCVTFSVISMVINAAQRGAGNTKIAMRTNLISNLVNICFNYLLINGKFGFPRLEVRGAAIATVIGTICAMVMSLRSVLNPEGFIHLHFEKKYLRLDKKTLGSIWNIGSSTLAEQLFLRFGFLTYTIIVAKLGTVAFAAHQIGMNILSLSFSFADGLSVAAVALVGQSLGQKRIDLAKIYGSICQRIGVLCSLFLAFIDVVFGEVIFGAFSDSPIILEYGVIIMDLISLIVFMQIAQVIYSGCLRGAGDTKFVALVSLISVACVRPLSGYLLCYPLQMGLIGAWLGLLIDQLVRLTLTSLRFKTGKWMNIKL